MPLIFEITKDGRLIREIDISVLKCQVPRAETVGCCARSTGPGRWLAIITVSILNDFHQVCCPWFTYSYNG